jgi:hypothetical protein
MKFFVRYILLPAVAGFVLGLALAQAQESETPMPEITGGGSRIVVEVTGTTERTEEAAVLAVTDLGEAVAIDLYACGTFLRLTVPRDLIESGDSSEVDKIGQEILDTYCGSEK